MRGPTGPAINPTLSSPNNVVSSTVSKTLFHLSIFPPSPARFFRENHASRSRPERMNFEDGIAWKYLESRLRSFFRVELRFSGKIVRRDLESIKLNRKIKSLPKDSLFVSEWWKSASSKVRNLWIVGSCSARPSTSTELDENLKSRFSVRVIRRFSKRRADSVSFTRCD